jgi:hypothetical protein
VIFALKSLRALVIALLIVCPLAAAETERPYLVIEQTTSPNGQYAVGWTLPKGPEINWEEFRSGARGRDYLLDLDNPKSDIVVENNLIELKSGRKLATVGSGYWALPEGDAGSDQEFHTAGQFMEVAWSAQSDFVLVLHRLRPGWRSLRVVQLGNGAVVSQLEFGDKLEAALRARLKKLYPQQYERHKGDIVVNFTEVKSLGGSRFSLTTDAAFPKREGANKSYEDSVVTFELRPGGKGGLSLHVLSFKNVDLEEAS